VASTLRFSQSLLPKDRLFNTLRLAKHSPSPNRRSRNCVRLFNQIQYLNNFSEEPDPTYLQIIIDINRNTRIRALIRSWKRHLGRASRSSAGDVDLDAAWIHSDRYAH
jgi:hypothetical protein